MKTPRRVPHSLAYQWAIVTAASTLIAFILVAGSWTWKLDQVLYDAGIAMQGRPARDDVLIVAIDNKSVAEVGRWPWRRATVSGLLERIDAGGPKAVGIDILFAETDYRHPGDDKLLASTLKHTPHAILPLLSVRGHEVVPIRILAENAELDDVGVTLDADGIFRRVQFVSPDNDQHRPHMAQTLAQYGGAAIPDLREGEYPIPFIGPPGTVRRVSAVDVLRGEIPPAAFKNKIILVGITVSGMADSYATPAAADGELMAGVEVSANIVSALLDGRLIYPVSKYAVAVISAAAMLLLLIAFYRVGPTLSLVLLFATVFLTPVLALLLLRSNGIWFAPISVALSALIAYPLWHWKRLEAICFYLDEELLRLERDHDNPTAVLPSGTVGFADYIQNRIELIRININYLRAARKFLNESLDGLPFAAVIVAPNGQLVVANRLALELCRISKHAISRHNIASALADVQPAGTDWLQAVAAVQAGSKLELKASDRAGREFEVAMAPFRNDAGVLSGLIVVLEDVTALRQAQREREDALSFLSHDIRSPQNSILALSELQRHEQTRKSETEFTANVEAMARKTMTLAEDFLQLIRADSKALQMEEYDLLDLVADCVAEIEPQAKAKQISIQMPEAGDQMTVLADRSLLTRAIGNLLGNAVKFTPSGGRVRIAFVMDDEQISCSVIDSGPGIEATDLPKLFKRFSRLETGETRVAGSGMGLAFVDVVARRHHGHVRAESKPGEGCRFVLVLPRVAVVSEPAPPPVEMQEGSPASS